MTLYYTHWVVASTTVIVRESEFFAPRSSVRVSFTVNVPAVL
jgi:hypothetical protein